MEDKLQMIVRMVQLIKSIGYINIFEYCHLCHSYVMLPEAREVETRPVFEGFEALCQLRGILTWGFPGGQSGEA